MSAPRRTLLPLLLALAAPANAQSLPFADAVRAGDLLFLSGQIGAVPGSARPVPGGVAAETRQAMENIGAVLKRRGLGYGDLVKCTMMLTDMAQWQALNQAYASFFADGRFPARSTIGAASLALGAKVEIDCTARVRKLPGATNIGTPLGPYSQAVRSGDTVYISGVIAYDASARRFAAGDITAQMQQVFANLDGILVASGLTRGDVVKTTVFLHSAADMAAANQAYAAYFAQGSKPARTMVPGADWGRPDMLVEIEAVAVATPAGEK